MDPTNYKLEEGKPEPAIKSILSRPPLISPFRIVFVDVGQQLQL